MSYLYNVHVNIDVINIMTHYMSLEHTHEHDDI